MSFVLEQAKHGNPLAIEAVVDRLRQRLARMAGYYARCCQEDADDLLQEAWVGVFEALEEVDLRIGNPEQYLLARARWRLLDAIKRSRIRRCEPLEDEPADQRTWHGPERRLNDLSLSAFAKQLKPTQRAVLDCLLDGLTWRQTGDTLGCTSANVAYHVRQIRREYEVWCGDSAELALAADAA